MEIHFYVLYALAAISIGVGIAVYLKVKTAIYLLEQPVVKKMSPQLNLKPIKVDQVDGDAARNANRNGTPMQRAPRPEGDRAPREDRGPRDGGRDRGPRPERDGEGRREGGDRGPRPEGDRGPREDRGPRGEGRGDRGDRFGGREGGRDRGGRDGHRHDRGDRGDRGPRREFAGSEREAAPAEARAAAPASEGSSAPAPLAPRRPLPSTVDAEDTKSAAAAPDEATAADPFFNRDDSDITHGRRNQLKKKPKFEEAEVEEKASEETKVL
jgi:translation initiation factor IF-2